MHYINSYNGIYVTPIESSVKTKTGQLLSSTFSIFCFSSIVTLHWPTFIGLMSGYLDIVLRQQGMPSDRSDKIGTQRKWCNFQRMGERVALPPNSAQWKLNKHSYTKLRDSSVFTQTSIYFINSDNKCITQQVYNSTQENSTIQNVKLVFCFEGVNMLLSIKF